VHLVGIEERQERVLNIGRCQLEDIEIFTDVSEVDKLQLLPSAIARFV